jgi:hypothetical protein
MSFLTDIQELKDNFRKQAEKIQKDKNLSDYGRRASLKQLSDAKDAALLAMVPQLRHSVVEVASKVSRCRGAKAALADIEKDKLNFPRLSFETESLRAGLQRVKDDPDAIQTMFDNIQRTGDTYRLRAFQNIIEEFIPPKGISRSSEWAELREAVRSSEGQEQGEEYQRYDAEEKALLENLHACEVETQALAHEMSSAQVGVNISKSIFSGLSKDQNGELQIHFGNTVGETAAQTEARLSKEREALILAQAEFCLRFGMEYDPTIHGLPEIDAD